MSPSDPEQPSFAADYTAWQLDDLVFTSVSAPAARSMRSADHVRQSQVDHWVITYCREGVTALESGAGPTVVAAGRPFLWTLGRTSDSWRVAGERQQLYLPRDRFGPLADRLDAAVGATLDTGLAGVLCDLMAALPARLGGTTPGERQALAPEAG